MREEKKIIIMNRAGGSARAPQESRMKDGELLDGNVFLHDDDENEFVLTDPYLCKPWVT